MNRRQFVTKSLATAGIMSASVPRVSHADEFPVTPPEKGGARPAAMPECIRKLEPLNLLRALDGRPDGELIAATMVTDYVAPQECGKVRKVGRDSRLETPIRRSGDYRDLMRVGLLLGIPPIFTVTVPDVIAPKIVHANYGKNVVARRSIGSKEITWFVGGVYAVITYEMPDGSDYVWAVGERFDCEGNIILPPYEEDSSLSLTCSRSKDIRPVPSGSRRLTVHVTGAAVDAILEEGRAL